ncbi:MAG TPA: OmpA family protein, partial [Novosphingobium sp.]|nr:OmpA family protein [Novosphingobium sp.]
DHLAAVFVSVDIHGAGVQGHTDALGSDEYNQKLSERRALAVRGELVRAGLIPAEVRAQGFGETRPVASNETDEGRAQNRRVVIVVTPADAIPLTN